MTSTYGPIAAWIRCRLRVIAIAALLLVGMGLLGAAGSLIG